MAKKITDGVKIISIATLGGQSGFRITYPENSNFSMLITTSTGYFAYIYKINGNAAIENVLRGSLNAKIFGTMESFLNTGEYVRAGIFISSLSDITVTLY